MNQYCLFPNSKQLLFTHPRCACANIIATVVALKYWTGIYLICTRPAVVGRYLYHDDLSQNYWSKPNRSAECVIPQCAKSIIFSTLSKILKTMSTNSVYRTKRLIDVKLIHDRCTLYPSLSLTPSYTLPTCIFFYYYLFVTATLRPPPYETKTYAFRII